MTSIQMPWSTLPAVPSIFRNNNGPVNQQTNKKRSANKGLGILNLRLEGKESTGVSGNFLTSGAFNVIA